MEKEKRKTNLVQFMQRLGTDGVWAAPVRRKSKENSWSEVQNLHKFPTDAVRGYVMGIHKIKEVVDSITHFDLPVWKTSITSFKIEAGMVYYLVCKRITR